MPVSFHPLIRLFWRAIAQSKDIDRLGYPHPSPLPCAGEGIRPPLPPGEGWGEGINSSSLRYSAVRLCVAVLITFALAACGAVDSSGGAATAKPRSTATVTPQPTVQPVSNSGLPLIQAADLPKEGRTTLALILKGGPFPYARDGVTFQNRERILPRQPSGYYREYTVPTPGENDRGARRLVVGREGEIFYTDDHYDSFSEVVP